MTEETLNINNEEKETANSEANGTEPKHLYFEVSDELLAKPNALCDIIEYYDYCPTIIFCNLPSDTDLVKVILKKRGINAKKLIGHVQPGNVAKSAQEALSGEVTALVVTDIGATHLDTKQFPLLVNYSIHNDPEIYLHRIDDNLSNSKVETIVSLVSPLDFTNFHYLKKLISYEIEKGELPSKDALQKKKVDHWARTANKLELGNSEHLKTYVQLCLEHEDKAGILAWLLHNYLDIMPSLDTNRGESEGDGFGRRGRGGNRGKDSRNGNSRGPGRGGHSDGDSEGGGRWDNNNDTPRLPKTYDTRFYIGKGANQGLTEESVRTMLAGKEQELGNKLKRVVLRKNHAYVDFPEEVESEVVEKLKHVDQGNGDSLELVKASKVVTTAKEGEVVADTASMSQDMTQAEALEE